MENHLSRGRAIAGFEKVNGIQKYTLLKQNHDLGISFFKIV